MGELLSRRAYARHRGVHHSTVQHALATGRIHATRAGLIDPKLADQEWPVDRAAPRTADAPRTAEHRRLGQILGGLIEPRAEDRTWLAVMDERERTLARAVDKVMEDLPAALVGLDADEMFDEMTEALEEALLAAEEDWRRRYSP